MSNPFGGADVWADTSGSCSGSPLLTQFASSDGSGNVAAVTFSSSSLGADTSCHIEFPTPLQVFSSVQVRAPSVTSTSALCSPATIHVGSTTLHRDGLGAFGTISGETISWSSSGGNLYFSSTACTLSGEMLRSPSYRDSARSRVPHSLLLR